MSYPVLISRRLLLAAAAGLPAAAHARSVPPPEAGRARPPLPLVMLDPGHGGKDPGAIGVSGTYEKHVAFAAAQELKRQLEAGGRCRVVLTRTRDIFIPLPERVAIAQRRGAALFMSMHADALGDHTVRGASVYTQSGTASDPQTPGNPARLRPRRASPGGHAGPQRRRPAQPGPARELRGAEGRRRA
jgi:N-acetylmuramoyl-L-alanine amidase